MNYGQMQNIMESMFSDVRYTREQGHKEYAHGENTFANFERIAEEMGLTREQVLLVYARKHFDGIVAWVNGHRSQREEVWGRIQDLILYMILLAGMSVEDDLGPELLGE